MNMLRQNPEFRRNLWLELSPQRLVLMPGLIALVLLVLSLSHRMVESTLFLALAGFAGLTIVWGATQAGNSLSHEFKNGTWDSQRMSSLTPWQMVWGKLLGGTLYAWYGGVILLALAAAAASLMNMAWGKILLAGAGLISLAILTQATHLLSILVLEHKDPGTNYKSGVFSALVVIFLLIVFSNASHEVWKETAQIAWYGSSWHLLQFSVFSLMLLTVWALIGVWQAMRRELRLKNRPWWWLAFLLFWIAWGAGFVQQIFPIRAAPGNLNFILRHANIHQHLDPFCFFAICALLVWFSVYLLVFSERKDQAMWIRFIAAWKRRDTLTLQHLLPHWSVSFAVALFLSLASLFLAAPYHYDLAGIAPAVLGIAFFAVRDIAWILWLNLAPGTRRANGAALVSLVIAYALLPFLSRPLFLPLLPGFWELGQYNLPEHPGQWPVAVYALSPLIQASLALWLLRHRWRKVFGEQNRADNRITGDRNNKNNRG